MEMKKITKACFEEGQSYAFMRGLTQWDQGQFLEISGLNISNEIVEVHFSLDEYNGKAERMLGEVIDGVIHTKIPQFIMEGPEYCCGTSYNAYAWVYVSYEESAETIRKIELEIAGRSKPEEYVKPEELSFLQQLENYISRKLDKSGHAPNKYLATDANGNVVTKDGTDGGSGGAGKSAYEIALEKGFEGTEEEWLESLKGKDGSNGTDGVDGFSPIANVTQTASGATISIQDKNGTTTATVKNGKDGSDASVTTENIKMALGYTPAVQEDVDKLSDEIADLKENGTVTAKITDKPFHIQKIGVLYDNPSGYDYIAWCPANLKYDEKLKKYVSLVYGSTQHVNGTTGLFVSYINPDTFEATAPVQCFTDDGTTPLKGSTAFWIEDDVYKMLYEYTDKKTYIFTSTDYGVNWVKGEAVSGFSGSPWGITKLSNGRLICADDQTKKGIYYSDNGGVNWTNVIPTSCGGGYEAEACILELQEGKLIAIARYSMSGIGYNASGASEPAIVSFSEDYGTTWTAWKQSETITNMNASSCTGHVHNGMVDIFACSRWYWHNSNKNDDYVNTGKTGAITHYTATVENALNDNFTNMGIVTYANAVGDGSSQDFHSPCMAVNGDDMLLMWFDRIYPYTEEITSHHFARGSKGDLDTAPRDNLSSAVFPYSSAMVDKLLKQQYTKLMTKINEIIINGGGTPDAGDDPENPLSYIFDGCIMNFNYLDATKYDIENMTLTDSINGEVGTFCTNENGNAVIEEFPEIRDNSLGYSHLCLPANTLSKYMVDDGCEFTIELCMYRYSTETQTENMSGAIPIYLFYSNGGGVDSLRINSNSPISYYLCDDGTMSGSGMTKDGSVNLGFKYENSKGCIPSNVLTHAVTVFKADGTILCYENGKYGGKMIAPDTFASWGGLNLTRKFSFNSFYKAVRVYNRALTDDEVLNNYNYEFQSIV